MRELTSEEQELVQRHMPLVFFIVKRRVSPGNQNFNDILQLGYLGLVEAVVHFDPSRNVKFSSYAAKAISNRAFLGNYTRYQRIQRLKDKYEKTQREDIGLKQALSESALNIEYINNADTSIDKNFHVEASNETENKEFVNYVLNKLKPEQKQILIERFVQEEHLSTIARHFGVSHEAIRQRVNRALDNARLISQDELEK